MAAAGLCLTAGALAAEPGREAEGETHAHHPAATGRAWRIISYTGRCPDDVTWLAEQVLDLSADQRDKVRALGRQQEDEKARLTDKLATAYTNRVLELLGEEQAKAYAECIAALEELAAERLAAREEFLDAAGPKARQLAGAAGVVSTRDLTRLLDLSQEKRNEIRQLRRQMYAAAVQAHIGPPQGEQEPSADAARDWLERQREMQQQRQAEFRQRIEALLSPEENEQLRLLEAAAEVYTRRLREAAAKATARLNTVLENSAGE